MPDVWPLSYIVRLRSFCPPLRKDIIQNEIDKRGGEHYIKSGSLEDGADRGPSAVAAVTAVSELEAIKREEEDGRRYANLQSKYIVIKFAAGNIFTGKYLETDGTNGVLSFGRPFTSRPEKLQFDFQYKTSPITRTASGGWKDGYGKYISRTLFEGLKGQPDSCNVYIALGDWEPTLYKGTQCPYLVRTRPSEFQVLDKNDPHIIAYAQMTCGRDVDSWTTEQLKLDYRSNRTPKYIIVVAASSKYGDYFTGGETSLMKIANLRLIY